MSETKIKLRTAASLGSFLDNVISESVKSGLHQKALQEKEKQQQASGGGSQGGGDNSSDDDGDDTDLFGDDNSGGGEGDEKTTSSKTMDASTDDDKETLEQGDVEPKDVIDKLNAIRSGKSFKDEEINSAMDQYINSLSKAEKTALLAFLKGIAQIVTGEIPAQNATEPDSNPADVHMKKGPEAAKTKHIQPNVIKASAPKTKVKGGAEDTSGPVPITPKKK